MQRPVLLYRFVGCLLRTRHVHGAKLMRSRLSTSEAFHQPASTVNDEPVKFSGSAADRDAYETFDQGPPPPPHQAKIVKLSVAAFLIYFLILREENDIDDYLSVNVFNLIDPYTEVQRLEKRLADEESKGMDTTRTKTQLLEVLALIQDRNETSMLQASLNRAEAAKLAKTASKTSHN